MLTGPRALFVYGDDLLISDTFADKIVKIQFDTLGLDEITTEHLNLKLYPNPTDGIFTIENSRNTIESITVFNTQGQLLFQNSFQTTNHIELDLSSYSKGVYMVNINESTVLKVIRN